MASDQVRKSKSKEITICKDCGREIEIGDWPFCPHNNPRFLNQESRFHDMVMEALRLRGIH